MAIQNYPRYLQFIQIENSAIRSAIPENSTLEQNMTRIRRPVAEILPCLLYTSDAADE